MDGKLSKSGQQKEIVSQMNAGSGAENLQSQTHLSVWIEILQNYRQIVKP